MNDLTILYVEDDEAVRDSFSQILQRYFGKVIIAEDGEKALELYEKNKPDIAFLDISIPFISGLDVAKRIREVDSGIEIVMLTAYADHEKLLQAVNLQLFAYLIKPVKKDELDHVLNGLVDALSSESRINLAFDYSWDSKQEELFMGLKQIKLTKNEKSLVELLLQQPNRYYKPCEIAFEIIDDHDEEDVICNNIVQLISRFKKRLITEHSERKFFIQNTYGSGYKLNA